MPVKPREQTHPTYRPEVDGLRAIAAILVVLYHADIGPSGGFVGVDVFFVLSGYLITSVIFTSLERADFSLLRFYKSRIKRLLPALYVTIFFVSIFAYFYAGPQELYSIIEEMFFSSLFLSNFYYLNQIDYFSPLTQSRVLLHTWSLGIEEQFYLLYPVTILAVAQFTTRCKLPYRIVVLSVLVSISIVSILLSEWTVRESPEIAFYLLPFRAWELLAGAIVYLVPIKRPANFYSEALSALGIATIMYVAITYSKETAFPGVAAIPPAIGTAVLLWSLGNSTIFKNFLSTQVLVDIGKLSYPIYLIHLPLFVFGNYYFSNELSTHGTIVLILLTLGLSFVVGKYIEEPLRYSSWRQRFGFKGLVVIAFFPAAILALYGLDGYKRIHLTRDENAVLSSLRFSPYRDDCHASESNVILPASRCLLADRGMAREILILGDSHGVELAAAMSTNQRLTSFNVSQLTFSSCRPGSRKDDFYGPCQSWIRDVTAWLGSQKVPPTVILAFRVSLIKTEQELDSFVDFVAQVNELADTIVVLQLPEVSLHTERYVMRYLYGERPPTTDQGKWMIQNRWINDRLSRQGGQTGFVVVDPSSFACDGENRCSAILNNEALFFDQHHPSLAGARLIGSAVADAVLKLQSPRVQYEE